MIESAPPNSADQPPSEPQALDDADLIAAWRKGGRDAVGALYRRHHPAVLRFATSLLRNEHDAQDVAHEAFRKTISAVNNGFGPEENFLAYLYTAVRAVSTGWRNKGSREVPVETAKLNGAPALDAGLEAIHQAADHEQILRALQSLPARWQTVLWYADVLQEPPRDIAPLMGLAPNSVSALIRRARNGLRKAYETDAAKA